ncbi:MAG: putative selenium-dependent hydroxylase accessory protein YqeC [Deltaproteobacteria bacterium]|nr:MAG: putative selenium-dependent hydroxylase accessory protein YqeC [Deltaproteobacteria bacterium]
MNERQAKALDLLMKKGAVHISKFEKICSGVTRRTLQLTGQGMISIIGAGGKTSLMFRLAKELADSGKSVLTTTTTKIFMPGPSQSPFTIIDSSIEEIIKKSASRLKQFLHFSAGKKYDPATGKLIGFAPDNIDQLCRAGLFDWIIVEADGARQKPIKATASHEPVVPKDTTHLILVTGLDALGKPLNETHVHRATLFSQNTGLPLEEIMDKRAMAACIAIEIKKAGNLCRPLSNFVFLNKADNSDTISLGQKIAELLKTNKSIHRIITASLVDAFPVKSCLILKK